MTSPVEIELHDGVAVVTIDHPPVNALSHAVRLGIVDAVAKTDADKTVRAVVLKCNGKTFVAGADIKEFGQVPKEPYLPDVVLTVEGATKPWIAAIHGNALGGGLEVALGCHYRIASAASRLGLPEVNLGLIPGAGGTVRLPRLVSMENALSLITTGKPVSADHALRIGLIDEIASGDLNEFAVQFAKMHSDKSLPVPLTNRPVVKPMSDVSAERVVENIRMKSRGQISQLVAAETIINGATQSADAALAHERATFHQLQFGDQSTAMRYIFSAERSVSKMPQLKGIDARPLSEIGVIGGGTMGAGIASSLLLSGLKVILIERDDEALLNGQSNIRAILDASLKRNIIDASRHHQVLANLAGSSKYESLGDADFIIEAVFEDMPVKKQVFKQLDAVTKPSAILASNTSYLDVNELAGSTKDPSRVVGLHFFSPAHIMKLVEVIRTRKIANDVLATSLSLVKRLGKLPVPAGVCDGFIGNRIMSAYRRVAECMLEDGAMPFEIDAAMKDYGFPMGVFEMQDLAGLDIGYAMRKRKAATRDPNERYVDVPDKIFALGRMGRKSGAGFYQYSDHKTPMRDELVEDLIVEESTRKNITRRAFSADEIMATLLIAMRKEGETILAEGIAETAEAIDVVMVNGYGFPRWRGGPMFAESNR